MLSEEALIVLAAFGACGLLVLGILELLWPTRPKHPVRRQTLPPPRAARPHRQSALVRHARDAGRAPHDRRQTPLAPSPLALTPLPPSPRAPAGRPPEPAVVETVAAAVASTPALEVAALPVVGVAGEDSVVERCFALNQQGRYAEVVERASEALGTRADGRPVTGPPQPAALWSVVALARQGLGDAAGARAALEAAVEAAPAADRSIYRRQLASLAGSVGQALLAEAERHPRPESEERLAMIRDAAAWLERGTSAAPTDTGLAALAAAAQGMLWPAWERTIMTLVQRQDFRAARRLLREALADPRFPAARGETFKALFSGTFSGELGQLTARAIRSVQEARESDALASLQRAETLLETLNDEALPPTRRQEVDGRLWWGYNRLGARRVEAGDHRGALEPLFHALGCDVGPGRRQETVALLMRALDGAAVTRPPTAREPAEARGRKAAIVQPDTLRQLLRSATEMGLTPADLGGTSTKVRRLFESLGDRT